MVQLEIGDVVCIETLNVPMTLTALLENKKKAKCHFFVGTTLVEAYVATRSLKKLNQNEN